MTIFDGYSFAKHREDLLKVQVKELHNKGIFPHIAAILFTEDSGSRLYTDLKKQAAERVDIDYEVYRFSATDPVSMVGAKVKALNVEPAVTGIIIQKPWRSLWQQVMGKDKTAYAEWWNSLVEQIEITKDVDGLHPQTLQAIQQGSWQKEKKVLPATVKAVLAILDTVPALDLQKAKIVILGKSDILGLPLSYQLQHIGGQVEVIGSQQLEERVKSGKYLTDADVVISSTGRANLITGQMVKEGVVVIDVGEPKGDVEFESVSPRASFITPVPGGVGPVTVVSLLENAVELVSLKN